MIQSLRDTKLRSTIFILIVLISVPFASFVGYESIQDASHDLKEIHQKRLAEDLSSLAIMVEWNYRHNHLLEVQHLLSLFGTKDAIEHVSLIGAGGKVLSSSNLVWQGQNAEAHAPNFNTKTFEALMRNHSNKSIVKERNTGKHEIDFYHDVFLPNPYDEDFNSSAIIYGEYAYELDYLQMIERLQERAWVMLCMLGLFVVALTVILRHWVSRPLEEIHRFVDQTSGGDWSATMRLKYGGEMQLLAAKLIKMRDNLRTTEHQKKRAHSLMANVIDSLPDLVFYKDLQGVYLGCNQSCADLLGLEYKNDIVGKTDADLCNKNLAEMFRKADQEVLQDNKSIRNQETVVHRNGKTLLLETLKTPFYDAKGEVLGVIGVLRDVTEYKKLERQYLQAQKMEAVGTLVGGIAHDFNNMLAGIFGNIYLLKQKHALDEKALARVENIDVISKRARDMVKQLLTFSRQGEKIIAPFDLKQVFEEIEPLLKSSVPENIDLQFKIPSDEMVVNGDETLLHQMVLNLVVNARDAVVNQPHPKLIVSTHVFEPDTAWKEHYQRYSQTAYACIEIEDNGLGIPKELQDKIFEPFFTTKAVNEGTGLGLAMVYGAVQTLKGIIDLESEAQGGTKFTIYLPLCESDDQNTDESLEADIDEQGHGELILLVDDQPDLLENTRDILELEGYHVKIASNGLQGVELFMEYQAEIDLVITDVVMPQLGGVEMVHQIRDVSPEIPVVFMTGYDALDMMKNIVSMENMVAMNKPVAIDNLIKIVNQMVRKYETKARNA
ncbi:MAG: response regulator [Ghiorsea sp.]